MEECKHRLKKIKIPKFIKIELKSDSDLDSDSEKIDNKLMTNLESGSDSE